MIAIFDSGVGGLSVFREIYCLLPGEEYVYYCDNANCPYGDKPKEFIEKRAMEISSKLISMGAEIIVVACNTATAAAIDALRARFDIPFIGMEPAIKPAISHTESGVVGVLATAGTFRGELYRHTSSKYKGQTSIIERVGKGLVELVESGDTSSDTAREMVMECIRPMLQAGADQIVLGCTHYPFLETLIRECAPGVEIINPAPAVARHTVEVLQQIGYPLKKEGRGEVLFIASGDDKVLKQMAGEIIRDPRADMNI